jgi:hypothetical protein
MKEERQYYMTPTGPWEAVKGVGLAYFTIMDTIVEEDWQADRGLKEAESENDTTPLSSTSSSSLEKEEEEVESQDRRYCRVV